MTSGRDRMGQANSAVDDRPAKIASLPMTRRPKGVATRRVDETTWVMPKSAVGDDPPADRKRPRTSQGLLRNTRST